MRLADPVASAFRRKQSAGRGMIRTRGRVPFAAGCVSLVEWTDAVVACSLATISRGARGGPRPRRRVRDPAGDCDVAVDCVASAFRRKHQGMLAGGCWLAEAPLGVGAAFAIAPANELRQPAAGSNGRAPRRGGTDAA